ncbi:MAG: SUMF1/EgtB/PvdO family nonheme iron enzyme [Planctomycetes bacterium]|nr:SUMF1/EgtB/PvdO family nonheme iron enzyme [Planctomycetota bacterium]
MSDEPSEVDDFLRLWLDDLDQGIERSVPEYERRFPQTTRVIQSIFQRDTQASSSLTQRQTPGLSDGDADQIGPYRLIKELGRGGQGAVWLAEDSRLNRRVALKLLPSSPTSSRATRARFLREAEAASRLDHPGICAVYEIGEHATTPFIAMQLIEGQTLSKWVAARDESEAEEHVDFDTTTDPSLVTRPALKSSTTRSTPEDREEVLRIIEEVARALHVAHEAGLVHRDVKPANIMIRGDGRAVLLDFGLAAMDDTRDEETLTRTGDLMGTPAYMSPEQLTAQRVTLDRRTDVYSLGVTLFECLTLRRPFEAPTREQLYQKILTARSVRMRELVPRIPKDVEVVTTVAMDPDRERRYATALAMAEDLARLRQNLPIEARPPGLSRRLGRFVQRNLALSVVGTLLVVSLATGLFASLREKNRADTAAHRAEARLAELEDVHSSLQAESLLSHPRLEPTRFLRPGADQVMQQWLDDADRVLPRLDRIAQEMMQRGLEIKDLDPEARVHDLTEKSSRWPDFFARRASLERQILIRAARLEVDLPAAHRSIVEEALSEMREELGELNADPRITEPLVIGDESTDRQRLQVAGMMLRRALRREHAELLRRKELLENIERRSEVDLATAWAPCVDWVRHDEAHRFVKLDPIWGVLPLGRNEVSGLWEFWAIATGDRPSPRENHGGFGGHAGEGLVFVLIPGGSVKIGCQSIDDAAPRFDDSVVPGDDVLNSVVLDHYLISKFEVTQAQWKRMGGGAPSRRSKGDIALGKVFDDEHPVEQVSWNEARRVLSWYSLELPTQAQWEHAARGGTDGPWWFGDELIAAATAENLKDAEPGNPKQRVRWWEDSPAFPGNDHVVFHAAVGQYLPNPFGLHDVLGNVYEWCQDVWGPVTAGTFRDGDGLHELDALRYVGFRVARGGDFTCGPQESSVARRRHHTPDLATEDQCGIRPVIRLPR